tara:strand:- start:417 stop:1007 length:591 start_codon:yes stop_codon:yes gene_type:complete
LLYHGATADEDKEVLIRAQRPNDKEFFGPSPKQSHGGDYVYKKENAHCWFVGDNVCAPCGCTGKSPKSPQLETHKTSLCPCLSKETRTQQVPKRETLQQFGLHSIQQDHAQDETKHPPDRVATCEAQLQTYLAATPWTHHVPGRVSTELQNALQQTASSSEATSAPQGKASSQTYDALSITHKLSRDDTDKLVVRW